MAVLTHNDHLRHILNEIPCILAFDTAADYLRLANGGYREKAQIFVTEVYPLPDVEQIKISSFAEKDFQNRYGLLCTTVNQTIVDLLEKDGDEQIITESLANYYEEHDHFDTVEDCNGNKGLGVSLMNLVNDMYAKDVSKRITTAFQSCMERGSVLGHAPYGYSSVNTGEGHKLVIDEPAAEIVRRIFHMAKEGMSHRAIARELTKSGVRTPEGYKQTQLAFVGEGEPLSEWKNGTISKILSNEVYVGTLQQGKTKRCLYQGVGRHRVEKEDWIILAATICDTHFVQDFVRMKQM